MTYPDYPTTILINHNQNYPAAYNRLAAAYLALEQQFHNVWSSRFFQVSRFEENSEICLRQITEEDISRSVDMADCEPSFFMRNWFYVDDAGNIQPVTIGPQERFSNGIEQPFHFAASPILAGGKQVGEVVYTDH